MTDFEEFLAGRRHDDVALFLADWYVDDPGPLIERGERVEGGVVVTASGDNGRSAFHAATGNDAMGFAKRAMGTTGYVAPDLAGGECPAAEGSGDAGDGADTTDSDADAGDAADTTDSDADAGDEHRVAFVFAFSEPQNESAGGAYAEGDVIHSYAQCACGEAYSHRWIVGDRPREVGATDDHDPLPPTGDVGGE